MNEAVEARTLELESEPVQTVLGGVCARCGSFTSKLKEMSLMNRGRAIRTWLFCDGCRGQITISDLLDRVEKELNQPYTCKNCLNVTAVEDDTEVIYAADQ